jgi:hypothetical protein
MCFTVIASKIRELREIGREAIIKPKREAIQLILASEFDEPPCNFYRLANRILMELEED